ncbi:MAG: ATP-binding protein [Bacteroidales bacterium]|nr:ATP-binding protein [Bacteroidales bacterium]
MDNKLINRNLESTIKEVYNHFPVITLTGPRQSGKTTLCRMAFPDMPYVNLEDLSTLAEVQADPKGFLGKHPNGLIIDEAQNYPEIFSYLQVAVDDAIFKGRSDIHYVVTGSNNFALLEKVTQSMAGRSAVMSLMPLSTSELIADSGDIETSDLILYGGYPAVWKTDPQARRMLLSNYYTTYIERDIRKLINIKDLQAFQTFIRLCAARIGQEFNASNLAVETGVAVNTIRHWLSILSASYVVYLLHPYYANIGKRLTKMPKLYFYDTGLASFLLGIQTSEQMDTHPLRGSLFENLVVNDIMKFGSNRGEEEQLFFYRDKSKHEVDVLRLLPGKVEAYEVKSCKTYSQDLFSNLTYLKTLLKDNLSKTMVIYDGDQENFENDNGFCNFRHLKLS